LEQNLAMFFFENFKKILNIVILAR